MTLSEFKAMHPEITASDTQIQAYLDLFVCLYGEEGSLCSYDYLQGLFVAHRSSVAARMATSSNPVVTNTSKSVGSVSTSGTVAGMDNAYGDFGSTGYGIEFSNQISLMGSGPMMAQ